MRLLVAMYGHSKDTCREGLVEPNQCDNAGNGNVGIDSNIAGKDSPIVNDNADKNCDGGMNDAGKNDVAGNGSVGRNDAGTAVKNPYGPWLMVSNPSQGNKKLTTKGVKMATKSSDRYKVTELIGTNHITTDVLPATNPNPKPLETVEHGNVEVEVIEQLHIEAMDINALHEILINLLYTWIVRLM
ncbi:hypothetical protein Q3G72_020266 [Acer saccharum]|nr:hypothetical protein Q3G72_020266 [Acer saccharum]